jgi:hypothetical protein
MDIPNVEKQQFYNKKLQLQNMHYTWLYLVVTVN